MVSKRVLVTGASGFIGQALVRALVRAGYAVRAATRRPEMYSTSLAASPAFIVAFAARHVLSGG
jgi:nucleoside-diphosphate-sugar epimerase